MPVAVALVGRRASYSAPNDSEAEAGETKRARSRMRQAASIFSKLLTEKSALLEGNPSAAHRLTSTGCCTPRGKGTLASLSSACKAALEWARPLRPV
jgi:hypothetical protein